MLQKEMANMTPIQSPLQQQGSRPQKHVLNTVSESHASGTQLNPQGCQSKNCDSCHAKVQKTRLPGFRDKSTV